jgi:hypothetical protein
MAGTQKVKKLAAESAFVFRGKIIKLKAATVPAIPTTNTAVVQVDDVVNAPAVFHGIAGQQITVRLKSLTGLKKGRTMTFFTNGWIYGSSIAVDAVGYTAETDKSSIARTVQSSTTQKEDSALKARLKSAEMAVVGTVSKVEPSATGTTHISEHDPLWHEATIKVGEVIKGKKQTNEVSVLFPQSDDVWWHKLPKYKEGQKGIWILQKGKKQESKGIPPKVFAAIPPGKDVLTTLHPADFLPLDELGKVKSLLHN